MPTSHNSQCSYCWAASGKGVVIKIWLELRQHHSLGNLPAPPHCLGVGPGTCQGNARELTQRGGMRRREKPFLPINQGRRQACCADPEMPEQTTSRLCWVPLLRMSSPDTPDCLGHQQTAGLLLFLSPHLPAKISRCADLGFSAVPSGPVLTTF